MISSVSDLVGADYGATLSKCIVRYANARRGYGKPQMDNPRLTFVAYQDDR